MSDVAQSIFDRVRTMPSLPHGGDVPSTFVPEKSQVLHWMVTNLSKLELAQLAFWNLQRRGVIRFNADTREWKGVSPEEVLDVETRRQLREQQRKAKAAAAQKERESRVRTGKVWHRPGHPPGRKPTVTWDTIIADKIEAYEIENGEFPTSGELRDYITGQRTCAPATYFRALKKAKDSGQVVTAREKRGDEVVWVLKPKETTPKPAIDLVDVEDGAVL